MNAQNVEMSAMHIENSQGFEVFVDQGITDSYGNIYSDVLYCRSTYTGGKYIIFVLDVKYSYMSFSKLDSNFFSYSFCTDIMNSFLKE